MVQKFHFLSRDERRMGAVELATLPRDDRVLGLTGAVVSSFSALASCLAARLAFFGPLSLGTSVGGFCSLVGVRGSTCAAWTPASLRDCLSGLSGSDCFNSTTDFSAGACGVGSLATLV